MRIDWYEFLVKSALAIGALTGLVWLGGCEKEEEQAEFCQISARAAQAFLALTDEANENPRSLNYLAPKIEEAIGLLEISSSVCLGVPVDEDRVPESMKEELTKKESI